MCGLVMRPVEAGAAGQQLERQAERLGPAAEQRADGDAVDAGPSLPAAGGRVYASVSISASLPSARR